MYNIYAKKDQQDPAEVLLSKIDELLIDMEKKYYYARYLLNMGADLFHVMKRTLIKSY